MTVAVAALSAAALTGLVITVMECVGMMTTVPSIGPMVAGVSAGTALAVWKYRQPAA